MKNKKKRVSGTLIESSLATQLFQLVITGSTDTYVMSLGLISKDHPLRPLFEKLCVSAGENGLNRNQDSFRALRAAAYVMCKHFSEGALTTHSGLEDYVKKNRMPIQTAMKDIQFDSEDLHRLAGSLIQNFAV